MTTVSFPFYPDPNGGFKDAHFRFTVKSVYEMEKSAGMDISRMFAERGRIGYLVLLICYGLKHANDAMTEAKALQQLDRFVERGGDIVKLTSALADAMVKSGAIGKPTDDPEEKDDDEIPTKPSTETVN
jgi:hypothetical protein